MKAPVQTNFKNTHSASYLARDIAQYFNKGSAIESKIETTLNTLRETTGVRGLKQIDSQIIEAYVSVLQDKVENSELSRHTAETYVSALNRIIEYTNTHLNKNLETVSQKEAQLSRGSFEYKDRSVSANTHNSFLSFLSFLQEKNDIKSQSLQFSVMLQREFGLRLRESLAIKQTAIQQAFKNGYLHLTGQDGTKNGRSRDIPIRTEAQKELLKSILDFQKENNLKSLAPTTHLREQYSFAKNAQNIFNKTHDEYYHFHGERHAYAQQRISEGADRLTVSNELGHNRQEVTRVYAK